MHNAFPHAINRLINELSKMPGIGPRSAERITFHILKSSNEEALLLLNSIKEVKKNIRFCSLCNNLSDSEICSLCSNPSRDSSIICVVEGPGGIVAMEKSGIYKGLYHVLLGELSPIDGVGPDDLKIKELIARVEDQKINEVVLATDFTTEGETTALYLQKILSPLKIKISRLARGVPVGASIEYADVATLQRAFEERR